MRRSSLVVTVLAGMLILGAACLSAPAPAAQPTSAGQASPTPTPDIRPTVGLNQATAIYDVVQRLQVVNEGPGQPSKHNLWIALISTVAPYQEVLEMAVVPGQYQPIVDEYGNRYAEFDLADLPAGSAIDIEIRYRVAVHRFDVDLGACLGDLPDFFTQPELHVESNNPQIQALAASLSTEATTPCQQVRAFYNYAADNLVYTYNGRDWGAQAALGEMGADCTEYASLVVALSRAQGIPARYLEGLYYQAGGGEELARIEHAWLEAYLPGAGWVPVDPTLARAKPTRPYYFAAMPPNHIIVTRGRHPSTLRGASYWTHLYWPGTSTVIRVLDGGWEIRPIGD